MNDDNPRIYIYMYIYIYVYIYILKEMARSNITPEPVINYHVSTIFSYTIWL